MDDAGRNSQHSVTQIRYHRWKIVYEMEPGGFQYSGCTHGFLRKIEPRVNLEEAS